MLLNLKEHKPTLLAKKGDMKTLSKNDMKTLSKKDLIDLLKTVLNKGISCRFQAKGFSMLPFIKNNDVITVSPLKNRIPGFGDVVAFIHPKTEKLTVHRIVGKRDNSYIIKSDKSFNIDGFIHKQNILGYLTKVERNGKEIHLGLGPEKFLIAFLARINILSLIRFLWRFIHSIISKDKK